MLSAATQVMKLALKMRASADLPAQATTAMEQLAAAGLVLRRLTVWLDIGATKSIRTVFLPRPVTRTTLSPSEDYRRVVVDGHCLRCDAEDAKGGVAALIPCGQDLVEVTCDSLPADGEMDLAIGLIALARRAADLSAIERSMAHLGQIDEKLLALHGGSLDLSGGNEVDVARRMVEVATSHLGYDRAGVFLKDEEARLVRGVVGVDTEGQIVPISETCFDLFPEQEEDDTEIARIVRGDLDHFLSEDLDGEGRQSVEGDIHHNALVPMCYAGRILGVLAVDNYVTNRPISQTEFPRLMMLANQGAVTLTHVVQQQDLRLARDGLEATVEASTAELANTNRQLMHTLEERRIARAVEQKAQQRLLHLLASGPAIIYSCRLESGFPFTFLSANVRAHIGYDAHELISDPGLWASRLHPEDADRYFDDTAGMIASGQRSVEYRLRHREGHWCWIQDEMVVIRRDHDGKGSGQEIVGSWLDISQRREVEAQHRQALDTLEDQKALAMRSDRLRSLGEMAAGIAHELNQPLAGVRGMAEHMVLAVARDWDLSATTIAERSQKIVDQADRMIHIINHVRVFARDAGKPETSSTDINDVARAAVDLLGVQLRTAGIELAVDLAQDLPTVRANAFSVEEVLLNLLANARDAVLHKDHGESDRGSYSDGHGNRRLSGGPTAQESRCPRDRPRSGFLSDLRNASCCCPGRDRRC
ncbi:MAG: PAS domain-containing protein [Gemmatimonadetes bacterium]|nr:PAS domain-containing protein [Gemmatimonadota bacterium]MBT5588350.1 PAS domain-containing protein [Gemmatimonadota bacterium]MBT5963510.1 PAS domain-containing protein [Gemmatimonadota bacterium]MBT6630586.1 PAS domain-containing protein [Gemmatimonadota bacterium]MBT7454103.1 PAS domain-containing protein [Gemmatimonadota bacterium]